MEMKERLILMSKEDDPEKINKVIGRDEFNQIVGIYEKAILIIKKQKLRLDTNIESLKKGLESEMNLPVNRMMDWRNIASQFKDSVEESEIINIELKNEYEDYIKNLTVLESQGLYINEENALLQVKITDLASKLLKCERVIAELEGKDEEEFFEEPVEEKEEIVEEVVVEKKMTTIERRKAKELNKENKEKLEKEMAKIEKAYPQIINDPEEKKIAPEMPENEGEAKE